MSVCPDGPGPVLPFFCPDGDVVVDEVGEVVGHEIFARAPHVHRVPELELPPEFEEDALLDSCFGVRCILQEDVVPDFGCQIGRSE